MNTALTELQLLNCAIDSGDPYFFVKLKVDKEWFPTFKSAYDFIVKYIRDNSEMPTLTTVRSGVKTFDFSEYESSETLKRRLGDALAKKEFSEWMKTLDTSAPFHKINESINKKSKELEAKYGDNTNTASNWRTNGDQRFSTYIDRETNKRALIPSGFAEIDKALTGKVGGSFTKGDYVVFYGATKRGKSHLVRKATTIPAIMAGFSVLDLCLENERSEIEFMLDSMVSANNGMIQHRIDGIDMSGGFDRRKLAYGYLDKDQREKYEGWTERFNESNAAYGDYYIKTFEDSDMDKVDIWKIKSLIQEYKPDMVLVDPIYLTNYPSTGEKTAGAGAQAMSRALRRLATQLGVVIVVTVQATIEDGAADDEDAEDLEVPPLSKVKTSKSLLEDGTITFGIDSNKNGKAILEIMLSRKGGAGAKVDIQFFPNYGICRSYNDAIKQELELIQATKLF